MPQGTSIHIKDSIVARLLKIVFSIYIMMALVITLVHMAYEFMDTRTMVMRELGIMHNTFEPGLALALWDENDEQIRSIAMGIRRLPAVIGLQVIDELGVTRISLGAVINAEGEFKYYEQPGVEVPAKKPLDFFGYDGPLNHISNRVKYRLGKLVIYSDSKTVFERVKVGFVLLLVNAMLKTVALWAIFLWFGRILLSRPLTHLTEAAANLRLDNLETLQVNVHTRGKNELKVLESAFNRMVRNLIEARNDMEAANHRLKVLFDTTKELMSTGLSQLWAMTRALEALVEELPHDNQVKVHIYFRHSDIRGTQIYHVQFQVKIPERQCRQHIIDLVDLHPMPAILPEVIKNRQESQEAFVHEDDLYLACWDTSKFLGAIHLKNVGSQQWLQVNHDFANSLGHSLTMALKNMEYHHEIQEKVRMESELKTAAAMQNSLLPRSLPKNHHLQLASFFEAASETGGDWYGFYSEYKSYFYFLIGDVTGHGTPSALVTAAVCATCRLLDKIHASINKIPRPDELMFYINNAVYEAGYPDFLMSFFLAQLNCHTGELVYCNAGHNFPYLIQENKVRPLMGWGELLGYRQNNHFKNRSVFLNNKDILVLYTDGLIETESPEGKMWGYRSVVNLLSEHAQQPVNKIVEALITNLKQFNGNRPLMDDVTLVCAKVVDEFKGRNEL